MSMNHVALQGRLTAAPEMRTTPNGKNVTTFSLAVDRDFKVNGERKADFFTVVAWGGSAEFVCNYFDKGSAMIVEGRLQTRTYQTQSGENRHVIEVMAENIYFGGDSKKAATGQNSGLTNEPKAAENTSADFQVVDDSDLPF